MRDVIFARLSGDPPQHLVLEISHTVQCTQLYAALQQSTHVDIISERCSMHASSLWHACICLKSEDGLFYHTRTLVKDFL